jgi:phage FluMu protein Com
MAVELRCPDCRAKLRLKVAPEAGTEVECPKCGTVFAAPEPEPEPKAEAPPKKAAGEKKGKKTKTKDPKDANAPRKRKAKKRETSKAALIGVICAGVLLLVCMIGVLIWYFGRTSKAVEMFYYVPEDAQSATGMNLGHAQKYPEFYKSIKTMLEGSDFKLAGDAIGKAGGVTDLDGLADYVAKAESAANGWAIVYRTKAEFDDGSLAKLPGGEKRTLDGKTFYLVPGILAGGGRARVFAPTNRLVVVTPEGTKEPAFKKMLNGHADSKDKTLGVRMGALGARVTRGTFWQMTVFDNELKPVAPTKDEKQTAAGDDTKAQLERTQYEAMNPAKGFGAKASLGSREVRLEIVVWYKDREKSSEVSKKWRESELGKGDEGTPPRWFKDATTSFGDRKIAAQILSNLSFGASGELFYVKTSVETVDLQQTAATMMGRVTGTAPKQGGLGGGAMPGGGPGVAPPPGGAAPPGGAPPPMPGGGGPPPMPKMRRRRPRARR